MTGPLTISLLALTMTCALGATSLAQRPSIEAGAGLAQSIDPQRQMTEHWYASVQYPVLANVRVGVDLFSDTNKDFICEEQCGHEFPEIRGGSILLSIRSPRLSVGAGPGLFCLRDWYPAHQCDGGVAAHADVTVVNLGPIAMIASVRPLVVLGASRVADRRMGVVPVVLGVRW